MCGRYATTRSDADLTLLFEAEDVTDGFDASWNVAPTDPVPVVRVAERRRVLDRAKWGLIPSWSGDPRSGSRMINARAETVASSPAFGPSFAQRRCLVPADGWFEWVRDGQRKQPYFMTPADGSVLAFAGLWSMWRGDVLTSTIITTEAVGGLAGVHHRMPLILPPERWGEWLVGDAPSVRPMGADELGFIEIRPVGAEVGNVHNNGPQLIARHVQEPEIPTLF
ncbi:SOS response-associated peptidase [Actinoplanes sp. NPDC049265]|uniref:SOS response-associated peptidase n=1 Tax=Actinoplanes sp. NPDC049265 TaxID=3363902 RepID=UPI00371FCA76